MDSRKYEAMRQAPGVKLTKRVVDQADLSRGRHYIWDGELKGFGLQVEPTGTKTYIVRYRPKGLGRSGPRRFFKLGRHGSITADEARDAAKTVLGRVANGDDPAAASVKQREAHERLQNALTVQQLGDLFLQEHARAHRKQSTAANYEILLRCHVCPELGTKPAVAMTREDLGRLHALMRDQRANANRTMALLSSMYSFAAKRGLVPEGFNPAKGIEKYKEEGRERYLTSDEMQRLGNALVEAETVGIAWVIDETNPKAKHTPKQWKGQRELQDPHAVAAIRLLLFTGARLREVLHLRWRHVDLERGLLFLPDSKTGKKTIVLNGAAVDLIEALAAKARADNGQRPPKPDHFVIRGLADDKPRSDLKRPWDAMRRHAKLEDVRLHDLRHTFASIGAGASLGLPVVGRLLGHSQPQTTARYAHLDADPLRRAANIIGDHLSAALNGRPAKRPPHDKA